jgi:hypothetical protein
MPTPRIIYLDQNKWIELAQAEKLPGELPDQFALLQRLIEKTHAGKIVFPLSATNIYETYKINDPERRKGLAFLQARLSGGIVFRARRGRLETELSAFLGNAYQLRPLQWPDWWFLSDLFLDAFPQPNDPRSGAIISDKVINFIREHPGHALNTYLTTASDDERTFAVKAWTAGSEALRARIELRRERHKNETLSMRRRIYSVLMLAEEVELLAQLAEKYGVRWNSIDDIGSSIARRIVEEMPTYYTERELVLRLEAQQRPINENDMRDIDAYSACLPYADDIVGENQMINLAQQARLGEKYDTRLMTDILALDV